jgi:hypothetical protein
MEVFDPEILMILYKISAMYTTSLYIAMLMLRSVCSEV